MASQVLTRTSVRMKLSLDEKEGTKPGRRRKGSLAAVAGPSWRRPPPPEEWRGAAPELEAAAVQARGVSCGQHPHVGRA